MKRSNLLISLACLLIPSLVTGFWFYAGSPQVKTGVMPDFSTIDIPLAPLSTAVSLPKPPEKPSVNILFDMSHGNLVSLSEIDPFIRSIESLGGAIHVTAEDMVLAESLKDANAFISLAPILNYISNEHAALLAFVNRGGKLLIVADPTRNMQLIEGAAPGLSGVDAANLLLEPYDVAFMDDYLYDMRANEGNYRNVVFSNFTENSLTKNVAKLVIYGGHTVQSHGDALAISGESTYSSATDQAGKYSPFALVHYGEGSVLAMGDLSLLTTQYNFSADNQVFTQNLAGFLTKENRTKSLADFPRIISGQAVLIPDAKIKVDADLVMQVSRLEKAFGMLPGELTISQEGETTGDRIVLGTFDVSESTKGMIEKLKINFAPEPDETITPAPTQPARSTPTVAATPGLPAGAMDYLEFPDSGMGIKDEGTEMLEGPAEIEIPGMGVVTTKDLGLVGLVREKNRTTLVIMAASSDNLKMFLDVLAANGLSGCFMQKDIAACKVAFNNDLMPKGG